MATHHSTKQLQPRDDEIRTLYLSGLNAREIAERLGVGVGIVYGSLNRQGIPRRIVIGGYLPVSDEQRERIRELYIAGKSQPQIAKMLGLGMRRVRKTLSELDIPVRSMTEALANMWRLNPPRRLRIIPASQIEQMRNLALSGHTLSEIAAQIGCSHHTVTRYMNEAGIEVERFAQPLTSEQAKLVVVLYEDGLPQATIAERVGTTLGRVRAALVTHQVPLRPVWQKNIVAPFPAEMDRTTFGMWLSGLTDGEGYFHLGWKKPWNRNRTVPHASFVITLRADDWKALQLIQQFFQSGSLSYRTRKPPANPAVTLSIQAIVELATVVVPHFERYPLWAKKSKDFSIWKAGVILLHAAFIRPRVFGGAKTPPRQKPEELEQFAALEKQLKIIRQYRQENAPSSMPGRFG